MNPETYFNELPAIMKQVPPLPGEEALQMDQQCAGGRRQGPGGHADAQGNRRRGGCDDPAFLQWRYNGRAAGNGWNSPVNNARWGTDYLNRTAIAKSNIYENRPEETKYIYTDNDSKGQQLMARPLPSLSPRDRRRRSKGSGHSLCTTRNISITTTR